MTKKFNGRVWFVVLYCIKIAVLGKSDYSWKNNVNIIRIQNNGSEIRTIYLPRQIYNTNLSAGNISRSITKNDNLTFSTPHKSSVNVDKQKKGSFNMLKQNILNQNMFNIVKKHKHLIRQVLKRKHKDHSINRTLSSTIFPRIEIKANTEKHGKLLNLFTIVNFTNTICYTPEGKIGTCYHPFECSEVGGQPEGECAQAFGVCCYVERSCGESSAVHNTYVTAVGIDKDPQTGVYICSTYIKYKSQDVRQLRLTFDTFELAGPVDGNCIIDRFIVTGQNSNDVIPPICGFNTGKHVYVDVDAVRGPVVLTVLSSGALGIPKNFRVLVTQLKKHDALLAPNNCLQFYTKTAGSVESFNYITFNSSSTSVTPGYFNSLNYAVCFKKLPGYCGITFSNMVNEMEYIFELVNFEKDGTPTVPEGQAGAEVFDCPDDYIIIAGVRLCGYKLNDASTLLDYTKNYPVTDDTNGPLILKVHTNTNLTGKGFHLEYSLRPCNISDVTPTVSSEEMNVPLPPSAATRSPINLLN